MNKFIEVIKKLDLDSLKIVLKKEPGWIHWSEDSGKNGLHYLCGLAISKDAQKTNTSLQMLKLLIKSGMQVNAVHRIPDPNCGFFPATPLWYAYTRGRNEKIFKWLLSNGANPENCMFAIAWYDDVASARLFKEQGAKLDDGSGGDTPFLAAFNWKRFNIARWLLENGADVNFADKKGNTALFYAVKKKYNMDIIEMLMQFGADENKENNERISPKKLAELNKQRKILKTLITTK